MHLRRLTFTTLALPFVFAACSSDSNEGVDVPVYTETVPNESMDGEQPAGNNGADDDLNETPNTAPSESNDTPTDGNDESNQATDLQQPDGTDMSSGANDDGTEGETTEGETEGESEEPEPVSDFTPTATVENRGAACEVPTLPPGNTLPSSNMLPDPFTRLDGTRLTQKSEWTCRREEILQQTYQYIYGQKPVKPDSVTGTVSNTQISVNIQHNGQTESFTAGVQLPAGGGPGPFPAVISYDNSGPAQIMRGMGVAVISFSTNSIGGGNAGLFGRLYGNNSAGNLAAWAWGVSRVIDVVQEAGAGIIDSTRLAVTGCSYAGKGAFAAGALDERIALTIPLESGIGGVPSYKIVPQLEPNPGNSGTGPEQPQHAINNGWLPGGSLVGSFQQLPVDTHEIIGLVAPRGLLILGNHGDQNQYYRNLNPLTEYATAEAGREIFAALGFENNISYDSHAVNHCQNMDRFNQAIQQNVDRFLLNGESQTGAFTTDWEGVRVSPDEWVDWTTPTLEGQL